MLQDQETFLLDFVMAKTGVRGRRYGGDIFVSVPREYLMAVKSAHQHPPITFRATNLFLSS